MELRPEGSKIYLLNLDTTRRESLGDFKGMVFAPRFSPDGSKVAFSVERGGNTDIFVMDLRSRVTARLPTPSEADRLRMPRNRPVLVAENTNVDNGGAVVAGGLVLVNSGYGRQLDHAGNALFAFSVDAR